MTLGRNKAVPALLVEAQTKFPDDPQVYYLRGNWMLYGTHDLIRAQRLFTVAAGLRPNIPGLHLAMAEVAMQNKDYAVAVRQCDQELKIEPGSMAVLMTKGLALARARQFSAALSPLKTVYAQTEYKLRPDLARSYAQVAYWNGKYEDAIEPAMLQLGITCNEANGDEDTLMKKILTDSLQHVPRELAAGTVATISAQMEKNAAIFKNGSYHRSVGDALREVGLHRLAVDEYQNCLKHNADDGRALLGLAKEFETTFADYKFALSLYERVRTVSPDIPRIDSSITRLEERIPERDQDIAWRLKDWLHRTSTEFGALFGGKGERPKPDETPHTSIEKR
jgi:tetratricopeptide (TPR) repeat protein